MFLGACPPRLVVLLELVTRGCSSVKALGKPVFEVVAEHVGTYELATSNVAIVVLNVDVLMANGIKTPILGVMVPVVLKGGVVAQHGARARLQPVLVLAVPVRFTAVG
ncbi:hypothetical protein AB0F52_46230 [Amycolatopsis sp. NPDC024027]|uniref:hypothetical protein n=1 Tax=Amycolatopsis sp. NPDC024027 TaxID=3154327 RepID=UPI0033EB6FB2